MISELYGQIIFFIIKINAFDKNVSNNYKKPDAEYLVNGVNSTNSSPSFKPSKEHFVNSEIYSNTQENEDVEELKNSLDPKEIVMKIKTLMKKMNLDNEGKANPSTVEKTSFHNEKDNVLVMKPLTNYAEGKEKLADSTSNKSMKKEINENNNSVKPYVRIYEDVKVFEIKDEKPSNAKDSHSDNFVNNDNKKDNSNEKTLENNTSEIVKTNDSEDRLSNISKDSLEKKNNESGNGLKQHDGNFSSQSNNNKVINYVNINNNSLENPGVNAFNNTTSLNKNNTKNEKNNINEKNDSSQININNNEEKKTNNFNTNEIVDKKLSSLQAQENISAGKKFFDKSNESNVESKKNNEIEKGTNDLFTNLDFEKHENREIDEIFHKNKNLTDVLLEPVYKTKDGILTSADSRKMLKAVDALKKLLSNYREQIVIIENILQEYKNKPSTSSDENKETNDSSSKKAQDVLNLKVIEVRDKEKK